MNGLEQKFRAPLGLGYDVASSLGHHALGILHLRQVATGVGRCLVDIATLGGAKDGRLHQAQEEWISEAEANAAYYRPDAEEPPYGLPVPKDVATVTAAENRTLAEYIRTWGPTTDSEMQHLGLADPPEEFATRQLTAMAELHEAELGIVDKKPPTEQTPAQT